MYQAKVSLLYGNSFGTGGFGMQKRRLLINLCSLLSLVLYTVSSSLAADNSSNKPLIGINVDYEEEKENPKNLVSYKIYTSYVNAVRKAGGIPVLIPPVGDAELKAVLIRLDGIVLIGGADYPASYYKEKNHETADEMHNERADFDLRLARMALADKSKPVLGICAGCQVLNIGGGGSLIQDIPSCVKDSKVAHRRPAGYPKNSKFMHKVQIDESSRLAAFYPNKSVFVPTSHHQCVDKVADQFKVVARAEDGVVEAIESKDNRFLFGVQWHPERDFDNNQNLWETFVKHCAAYNSKRPKSFTQESEMVSQSQP